MPDVTDIMNQYLDTAMASVSPKMSGVAAAAEKKKAQLDGQGYLDAATRDVGYSNEQLDPTQPVDISSLLATAAGDSRYIEDASHQRTMPQAIGDSFNSAAQALFTTPLEIANLGISAVSPDAGAAVTDFIQDGLDNAQSIQSDGLNARRRAYAGRSQITTDINEQKYRDEVGKDGAFVAGLKRIGRDAMDSITNTDSVLVSDLIANAAGSLATAGPISKVVGFAGKGAMPLAIGLQEAGGVHHQTSEDILSTPFEDLAANSPEYRQALADGMSPDEARNLVARNAGLEAAAIQLPIAAATGTIASKFEKAPLKAGSVREAIANTLKEGLEESIQSGTGQVAQNVATRDHANESQDLLDGVGEQVGQGAIGGLGSGAGFQAPAATLRTASAAVAGTARVAMRGVKAVGDQIDARYNSIVQANEKASPVSDENIRSAVDAAVAASPAVETTVSQAVNETKADDAQKARAFSYVNNLVSATTITDDELADPDMPAEIRDTLASSKDRLDAMQRLASMVEKSPEGSAEQLTAAATLYNTIAVVDDALGQTNGGAIDELSDDHPAKQLVGTYEDVLGSIRQSASVSKALNRIDEIAQKANENGELKPVDEAELNTPEGKQAVRNTIAVAEASPLNGNADANDQILRHAEAGKVNITPAQRIALQTSSSLIRAQQARLEELNRLKLTTNRDVVSEDILTRDSGQESRQPSVATHVKRIIAAARSGDQELTSAYVNSLVRFAQHMQNKVGALNEALSTGANSKDKIIRYRALTPNGRFMLSPEKVGMWINPYAPGSVKTAQQVASDADIVARVANDMVSIFPDLGIKSVETLQLDQSLMAGTAEDVANTYRQGRAAQKTETATPEPAETGQPKGGDQTAEITVESYVDDYIAGKGRDSKEHEQFAANNGPAIEAEFQRRKAEADAEAAKSQEKSSEEPKAEQPSEQSPAVEEKQEASSATEDAPASAEAAGREEEAERATESAAEPEPKKSVFDKLPEWSRLKKIFRIPDQPKSRILGTEKPLEVIKQALSSAKALQDFLGSELKHNFTDEMASAYGDYLTLGETLKGILNERLAESKEAARLLKGEERVVGFNNGRVLNLTEEADGKLAYNQELVEGATLAAMQWLLVADRFQTRLDREDAAELLGDRELVITDGLLKQLNEGLGTVEAKRSLARMIRSYWGLAANSDAPIGQVEGLSEAMAAELLNALVAAERVQLNTVEVTEADGLADGEKRTLYVFLPRNPKEDNPILAFPTTIEQAVLTETKFVNYIGKAPTKVADTQLRNPDVKLTDQQKEAIRFEQKQKHFVNLPMVNLYTALGLENVLELFAAGDLSKTPLNVMDKKSKDGLNATFGSAYNSLVKLMAEVRNRAEVEKVEVDQLPIHYDYAFTRVNRMQMLGLNNPQASKLMREAILPTRATVDLSSENSEEFGQFALGLAQALGVKVHNVSRDVAYQQVSDLLADKLANSVEILEAWLKDQSKPLTAEQVSTIKSELGSENTPVALHALTEFARYQNASPEERKAFTTSLYVEADGVTNGPVNAMVLLTPGRFNLNWLRNVRKGGLFPGAQGQTMNNHRQVDGDDLYTDATNNLFIRMADLTQYLRSQPAVDKHMTALSGLMEMFLPDVTINDDGEIGFKRGIAKNPMTITIYGSGAKGIAGKVSSQLMDAIYERLTEALKANAADKDLTLAQAMFPGPDAQQKYEAFVSHFKLLTSHIVSKGRNGYYIEPGLKVSDRKQLLPETFELEPNEFKNLRSNMLTLFVNPMREAIRETIGDELLHPQQGAATVLRQAIQIQSIFLEHTFQQKVQEKLAEKAKDPEWTKDDFLSRDELRAIFKELAPLAPIIETGAQNYSIAHSQAANVADVEFGSALTVGKSPLFRTPGEVNGPSDAGVAGIPSMVIGSGDGMMMQLLSTMNGAPDRTLKVFDGMHLPLDNLQEGSQKANQAVFESWMGNPLKSVSKSYTAFLEALSIDDMSDAQIAALVRALNLRADKPKPADLEAAIRALGPRLELMSLQVEARHKALARVGLSVDQMAAVGAPYVHEGEVSLEGLSDEQVVSELNRIAREEYEKLTKPEEKAAKPETKSETVVEVSENIAPELESVGRLLKNGARVVSHTALRKLARSLNIPAEQKALLGDMLRTLSTKEYKIVYGSPEQVQAYADERGIDLGEDMSEGGSKVINGFIDPVSRTIFLHNPSSEVLVHELIHAATMDQIYAYYQGGNLGPNGVPQVQAIQRLEELMTQFLELNPHGESEATQKAWFEALEEIEGRLEQGNKAAALSEFVAWGLANSKLQELQKKTQASPLVQLARKVVAMLKRLVAGRRQMPKVADDMFSNLRFNANILMQTKFDARKRFADTVLFHSQSYGSSDRLAQINQTLNRKIVRHLRASITGVPDKVRDRRVASQAAKMFSSSDVVFDVVDKGFSMNAQERTTFQLLVSTLRTSVQLDPNALARVQDLFTHVTKNLRVEDFMRDPEGNDPRDYYQAKQKFDVVVGNSQVETDDLGRSSLLPVFLGLATVNDEFRAVLAKMEVPKTGRREGKSIDAIVENLSNAALDELTARVSGEGSKSPDVQAAIDALIQRVMDTAEDRESYLQQMTTPAGNVIDRANEIVVNGMQKLAEKTVEKADELKAKTNNKLIQTVASAAKGFAGMVDERTGSKVAEGVMSGANRHNIWKPIHELLNDLIGRTESNASVYDMIKTTRDVVQQRRQQFREHLPTVINSKFSRKLTDAEQTAMFNGLGKTDLAALRPHLTQQDLLDILEDPKEVANQIEELETELKNDPDWQLIQKKAKQLAHFMNTGEVGFNLLRNAKAVANLFGEGRKRKPADAKLIKVVDQLTTLYAFDGLSQETRDTLSTLAQEEADGVSFVMEYLVGQRTDEVAKAVRNSADVNHYKGALPVQNQDGLTLIVADDADYAKLAAKSFIRVGDYEGSTLDRGSVSRGYYFAPVSGRAVYNQGILQNVRPTAYGVDLASGFTHGMTAGRIEDPAMVKRIYQRMHREKGNEPLMPVYDSNGDIVAFERSVDPKHLERLNRNTNLSKVIGIWRGRQLEELEAQHVNERLIDRLHEMWQSDLKKDRSSQAEYVDVRDPRELKKDPVLADAVKLFSADTHSYIDQVFGDHFYIRRDMLNDAIGYHAASVGDLWTKNTRLPKEAVSTAQKLAISVFGNDAYRRMVNAEKTIQNLVNDARVMIVVKSVVVPVANLMANVYQLWGRGIPIVDIGRGMPRKMAEVNSYLKSRLRLDEAEAELRAATDNPIRARKLEAEMQSIKDSHRRMSIWPLIEAGEFSSISDGTLTHEDLSLTEGRLSEYIEKMVDRLPAKVRDLGRYAVISRDTALFQALQRSVEYGDFLAKAVLYDHLTKRKKLSQKDALARITEEYVNYDRLPGRSRGYAESMGVFWFWNFKIRSTKVALSMLRNNPVHALLANAVPHPTMFGSVGSPLEDNIFTMAADGSLDWSMGPGMGLRSPSLLPWFNLVN